MFSAGLLLISAAGILISSEMAVMAAKDLREDIKQKKQKKLNKFKGQDDSQFNEPVVESNADEKYETEENIDNV